MIDGLVHDHLKLRICGKTLELGIRPKVQLLLKPEVHHIVVGACAQFHVFQAVRMFSESMEHVSLEDISSVNRYRNEEDSYEELSCVART